MEKRYTVCPRNSRSGDRWSFRLTPDGVKRLEEGAAPEDLIEFVMGLEYAYSGIGSTEKSSGWRPATISETHRFVECLRAGFVPLPDKGGK